MNRRRFIASLFIAGLITQLGLPAKPTRAAPPEEQETEYVWAHSFDGGKTYTPVPLYPVSVQPDGGSVDFALCRRLRPSLPS